MAESNVSMALSLVVLGVNVIRLGGAKAAFNS